MFYEEWNGADNNSLMPSGKLQQTDLRKDVSGLQMHGDWNNVK